MASGSISLNAIIAGNVISGIMTRDGDGQEYHEAVLAAGKVTTDWTLGTLTATVAALPAHGIAAPNRVDIYWTDPTTFTPKVHYGSTVSFVNATTIILNANGNGDALPVNNTVLVISKCTEMTDVDYDPNNVALFEVSANKIATIAFEAAGAVNLGRLYIPGANESKFWASEGIVNYSNTPSATPIVVAYASTGSTSAGLLRLGLLLKT